VVELLRRELEVSATAAGLVVTGHGLTLALASPLVGRVIDRRGVRAPLTVGLVLYGVAGGAGLPTMTYPALLVSRLLFGVGVAVVFTGTTVALLDPFGYRPRQAHGVALHRHQRRRRHLAAARWGRRSDLLARPVRALPPRGPARPGQLVVLAGIHAPKDAPAPSQRATPRSFPPARVTWRGWMTLALLGVYGLQLIAAVLLCGFIVFAPLRLAEVHSPPRLVSRCSRPPRRRR
jgi:MFS transporter, ACDE family, multidrug resistance protein